jgi:hypothetical protein
MCERDADVQTDYQAQDKSQPVRVVKGVQFLEADQLDAEVPPFIYSRVAQGAIRTHPVTAPGQVILSEWMTALMQRERRSEVANSMAGVRECAWRDDPAGGPVRRRAKPVDRCR